MKTGLLVSLVLVWAAVVASEAPATHGSAQEVRSAVEANNNPASGSLDELGVAVQNKTLEMETDLRAALKKVEKIIDMTFDSVDEATLRNAWREGLAVEKDLQFEADVTFYKLKTVYDYPCKSINFLFGIRSEFDVFAFNARRFPLCFLKFFSQEVKEFLSDLVVEGSINVLRSGRPNPVSTFFTNLIIIEGPLKLKEELFGALYKYVEENHELNRSFEALVQNLVRLAFDKTLFASELRAFRQRQSTALVFFFYDMLIMFLEDREVYLSAYDFIQPDASLVSNPQSMDPKYVTDRYSEILAQDLRRFKEIQAGYRTNPASTVYHRTYAKYIDKNVRLLCRIIYHTEDC